MIDFSELRTKRMPLSHGVGHMPVLGFGTLIPDHKSISTSRNALSPREKQGLGNRLIVSDLVSKTSGPIRRRERLGGMMNYYYRAAA